MTHFEAYRWEDHVPRSGSWKFNLPASLLAFGLIGAAFPGGPADRPSDVLTTARPVAEVSYPAFNIPRRDLPVASFGALDPSLHCPTTTEPAAS
jgi:hypothetical protein